MKATIFIHIWILMGTECSFIVPAAVLKELRKREKEMGIEPDWHVDAMMKAETLEGFKTSIITEFIIRMLGLGICSDTMVRLVFNPQACKQCEDNSNPICNNNLYCLLKSCYSLKCSLPYSFQQLQNLMRSSESSWIMQGMNFFLVCLIISGWWCFASRSLWRSKEESHYW